MESNYQTEVKKGRVSLECVEKTPSQAVSSEDVESERWHLNGVDFQRAEKRLLRKIDYNILPLMFLSMFISFLVRGGIYQYIRSWILT